MKKGTVLTVIVVALLAAAAVVSVASAQPALYPCGGEWSSDAGGPPAGSTVTSIIVKAGDTCYGPYTSDGTYEDSAYHISGPNWGTIPNSCYEVSGIGSDSPNAEKVGEGHGSVCQDISHIEGDFDPPVTEEVDPTSTPTPTPVVTEPPETPTDEPTPTETPTDPTPEETPTDEPTPTETPTIERLPDTGWSSSFVPGVVAWQITDNAWAVHQGVPGGYEIALWNQGYAYDFEGMRVVVRGSTVVSPEDVEILYQELPGRANLILITCTNLHDGIWHNRLVLYVEIVK